jgi:hypothetical protein
MSAPVGCRCRGMRSIVGAVVLLAVGSAFADDVVLKTGRTLVGRIVKEDDAKVVLEMNSGTMTLARDQIAEIRRGAVPVPKDVPEAPPARKPESRKPEKKPDGKSSAPPAAKKPSVRDKLAELEAISLAPWVREDSTLVTEPDAGNYRVQGLDGSTRMKKDRPTSPDGIDALYVCTDSVDGMHVFLVDGRPQLHWVRLYWHDDERKWTVNHPNLDLFHKERALAGRIADLCCRDENGRIAAACAESSLKHALGGGGGGAATKERAKLREACVKATGSADAGELLAQVHETDVEIEFAKRTTDKIALAMKRRGLLRRLVEAVGA